MGDYLSSLHFGFEEFKYPDGMTTVDVANILESQYHIVEHFFETHQDVINELVHEALAESIETAQVDLKRIEELFRGFLDSGEMEKLGIPGVPTEASLKKIKVRSYNRGGTKVKSYTKLGGSVRPSFVHLGLYRDSFRVWLERL